MTTVESACIVRSLMKLDSVLSWWFSMAVSLCFEFLPLVTKSVFFSLKNYPWKKLSLGVSLICFLLKEMQLFENLFILQALLYIETGKEHRKRSGMGQDTIHSSKSSNDPLLPIGLPSNSPFTYELNQLMRLVPSWSSLSLDNTIH